jgi:hypothetical protein
VAIAMPEFLKKKVFGIDGITLTVGGVILIVVLIYLYKRSRG